MTERGYTGLLIVGDPHLEGRRPGFRKDEYPRVILGKLRWCLNYAAEHRLLPAVLGDLFDKPRDNPNWMLCELIDLLAPEVVGVYGNHDCAQPELTHDDSLSILERAGRYRLLDGDNPWRGRMNGRSVVVGGASYRREIPAHFDAGGSADGSPPPFVAWLIHHDILVPGYEDHGCIRPRRIPGVDVVVNGHIHRRLDMFDADGTVWLTPGNISRRTRSEATHDHVPAALRIDVTADGWSHRHVEVPHAPFDEVFHEAVFASEVDTSASALVAGLAELQARRTDSAAGLMEFLEQNLGRFEEAVAGRIRALAEEVMGDGQ